MIADTDADMGADMTADAITGTIADTITDEQLITQGLVDINWWDGKSVLVIGATGLIGSTTVRALNYIRETHGLSLSITAAGRTLEKLEQRFSSANNIAFWCCDVSAFNQFPRHYDVIIDAASSADPASFANSPVSVMHANLTGAGNLLEQLREQDSGILVYISSGEVYGSFSSERLMTEEMSGYIDTMSPRSCYPSSKRAAETLCASYCQQYGVDVRIARPAHIFGPGFTATDSRASAAFFRDALQGKDLVLTSSGKQHRTFTYITDCVSGLLSIASNGTAGQAYNVSNENNNAEFRQFAQQIADAAGVRTILPEDDAPSTEHPNLIRASSLSDKKLRSLGWRPQVDLSCGIIRTITALRSKIS